jgi:hypothetical protein
MKIYLFGGAPMGSGSDRKDWIEINPFLYTIPVVIVFFSGSKEKI